MTTPNLGLKTYNTVTDSATLFLTYVNDVSGSSATENLSKIDTFAGETSASMTAVKSGSFVVLSLNPTLPNEWLLSAGSGITIAQNINGSSILINSTGMTVASASTITAGTNNTEAVSASGLAQSNYGKRIVVVPLNTSASLAGTEFNYVRIPAIMNGWVLVAGEASVSASCTTGSPTFGVSRISASSPDTAAVALVTSNIFIKGLGYDSSTSGCVVTISAQRSVLTGDRIKVTAVTSACPASYSQVSLTFQNLP